MRVLVTGGAGFLGSHVVDALVARGDHVLVIDDLSTGDRANLNGAADLRVADIADMPGLERALASEKVNAVIHCAAKTKVVVSMEKEDLYRRVILEGTDNVLELAKEMGATDFVNISTGGAIYGETPVCADETVPVDPPSNYGRFKAQAERLVARSTLRSITLRLANIYGPRQRRDLEGGVIAIYGDGEYERDYVYVGDVAEAVMTALRSDHEGIYNIGTGVATSVKELVAALSLVLGPPPGIRHAPARAVEVRRVCVDPAKAARDKLWRPRTDLATGLREMAVAEGALDRRA